MSATSKVTPLCSTARRGRSSRSAAGTHAWHRPHQVSTFHSPLGRPPALTAWARSRPLPMLSEMCEASGPRLS